ncbi:MAG: hypothetical protein QG657_4211, partial [Acidobacteriota bacterium]|nr:hypothetical protein [Acidobacteriota bacterium]
NDFFKEVRNRTLEAYENQEYPFEVLVDKIALERDTSRNPVFDVMFNLLNQTDYAVYKDDAFDNHEQGPYVHIKGTSKFDMNLTAVEMGEKLYFVLEYSTCLFKPETIEKFIRYLKNLLQALTQPGAQDRRLWELEIINESEKNQLLYELNNTAFDFNTTGTLDQLFAGQVNRIPDHAAVVFNNSTLTYRELDQRSDRLANTLSSKGAAADTVVGLMIERSFEMIIGVLGILKTGSAYLPIDPEYPKERIDYMLKDSNAKLTINYEFLKEVPQAPLQHSAFELPRIQHSNHLAYIIYTSGSTGKPKAVMLEHRNLVNLILFGFKFTTIDFSCILQFTTISFDISFQEIFSAFLAGGKLILIQADARTNIPGLFNIIEKNEIRTVFFPMSMLKVIFNEKDYSENFPRCIRHIITAGEQVVVNDTFREYLQRNKVYLHNHYGPAEAHVVTAMTLDPAVEIPNLPPIGKPVTKTVIYILDKYGNLQPIGVQGELYIGGAQVGRGYLNRPELTRGAFEKAPLYPPKLLINHHSPLTTHHSPLYKTGDLARWLDDGNIEFLGRIDHQVKIRGFRIEPGEIESRLLNHQEIREVVVLLKEDQKGDKYLCAYVVLDPLGELNRSSSITQALRNYLAATLPDYMIPSYYVKLDHMPLNPNAKIDRKALPEPAATSIEGYKPPRHEIEMKLLKLWSDVLSIEEKRIGIADNFFHLGGHSLKAVLLAAKIHKELNTRIPLKDIFQAPTIEGLAKYINDASQEKYTAIEPDEKKEYYEMSHAQARLWILDRMEKDLVAYNMPDHVQLENLDRRASEKAVETLIKRHEILRTTFITVKGEPKQKVHNYEEMDFNIPYFDLRNDENKEITVNKFLESENTTPFNLEKGPMLRTKLLQVEENRFLFLYTLHHIISDQWSMSVVEKEFLELYNAYDNSKENPLAPLRIQYKDYTRWHLEQLTGENLIKHQHYWHNRFKGEIPRLELPTDFPRTGLRSFAGEFILFSLSKEMTGHLKGISKEFGTTLFITLLSVVKVFLYRYTGQEDIIVGTLAAGREHKDLENQIGFYVNMLPLRNQLQGQQNFAEVLQIIDKSTLEALEHQVYPFDLLVHELNLTKDMGRSPLVDVVIGFASFDNQTGNIYSPDPEETNGGDDQVESGTEASKHDLRIRFTEQGNRVLIQFRYNPQLFKKERIIGMKQRFTGLVTDIVSNINKKIDDLHFALETGKKIPGKKFSGGL